MINPDGNTVVAIIGGGFTGGAVAWQLARNPALSRLRIVVFEPRDKLGAGLAYDTSDPVHRINVPATRMSLDPTDQEHFSRWIEKTGAVSGDIGVTAGDGQLFPQRQVFGAYVNSHIRPFIESGRIEHIRNRIERLTRHGAGWVVESDDGMQLEADLVVIATSHPSPAAPRTLVSILEGHPRFVADATVPDALHAIRPDDTVLLVGNGLTSADVIASLVQNGHRGKITSISRRGLRSRGHAPVPQEPYGDFTSRPILSARHLTRRIREAIREAAIFDVSWHAVIDAVRAQGQDIWKNLPIAERKKIVRHLRPFWDVHRFRIAPQVENALVETAKHGQLETLAASVGVISYHEGRIRGALKLARRKGSIIRDFDALIVTTGPAHGSILESQQFLEELAAKGLIASDPAHLGIACNRNSQALDQEGRAVPDLYIAGPLARGTFGELMGLPQVSEHAAEVARQVAEAIEQAGSVTKLASDAA
ncbi:FAD/NAD(P)-binding protein [Rhizobium sp. KVB221]|uniref:FAD/NAD(P)-binding protein n=1 Tax=Rhizobium setariae TaxID=2801340 RepID=A0A936YLC7_9HYPH|nr:FAD/NAD(P)-binding protein [Rhizobium setariae]MBL0372490.1 FAD/NAD(P)-binding protein [Rhizobium setariae]